MAHQTHAIESIKLEYFLYATTCIWLQIWSQIDVTCIGYKFDHQVAKLALPHCIDWDCPTVFTSWYQVCVFISRSHINKVNKTSPTGVRVWRSDMAWTHKSEHLDPGQNSLKYPLSMSILKSTRGSCEIGRGGGRSPRAVWHDACNRGASNNLLPSLSQSHW